jgi:hypothetical protein
MLGRRPSLFLWTAEALRALNFLRLPSHVPPNSHQPQHTLSSHYSVKGWLLLTRFRIDPPPQDCGVSWANILRNLPDRLSPLSDGFIAHYSSSKALLTECIVTSKTEHRI